MSSSPVVVATGRFYPQLARRSLRIPRNVVQNRSALTNVRGVAILHNARGQALVTLAAPQGLSAWRSDIAQLGICEMSVRKLRFAPFSSGHIAYPARVVAKLRTLKKYEEE